MSEQEAPAVRLDLSDGLATVTLDRPKSLNALDRHTLEALWRCLDELTRACDDTSLAGGVRCAVLRSEGKAFVAGADISEMDNMDDVEAMAFSALGHQVMEAVRDVPVPVIAAVQGHALGGGCELAVACDLIVASTLAVFALPEVKLGLIPGFGGHVRLAQRVGLGAARDMIFSGRFVDAAEAHRLRLVDRVCEPGDLEAEVQRMASTITSRGPRAVRHAKGVLREVETFLPAEAMAAERRHFAECFHNGEGAEGMKAFLEKRKPSFASR